MRKYGSILIILTIAALVVSACTAGNTAEQTPGSPTAAPGGELDATLTPLAPETPAVDETALATATTTGLDQAGTATPEGTGVESTGTPEADATLEGTTEPEVSITAPAGGLLVRLESVMDAVVYSSDNQAVGRVDGVVLQRPVISAPAAEEEAAEGEAAATPAPTETALSEDEQRIYVRYVLVDASDVEGAAAGAAGQPGQVLVPWEAFTTMSAEGLALQMDFGAFAGAPRTSLVEIASREPSEWTASAGEYWTNQGLAIPATGPMDSQPGSLALIMRERGEVPVSGLEGESLAGASDMLIDRATGEVLYVVFEGGEDYQGRVFAVPAGALTWTMSEGEANVQNRGSFNLDFPADRLEQAPSFTSIEELDASEDFSDVDDYWREDSPAAP